MRFKPAILALVISPALTASADTPVSGTISANTTWSLASSPYLVTGNVTVTGAGSPVLTIQAGVTVKFNSATQLMIGSGGGLQAIGTLASPITFTSSAASPTRGSWRSVYLGSGSLSTSRLSYVNVGWGGATDNASLVFDNCAPTIDNVTVSNSSTDGVNARGASANPTISNLTSSLNTWAAMSLYVGARATLTNVTLTSSAGAGFYLDPNTTLNASGLTITNNTGFAISQKAKVTLGTVTGLVATGNGSNSIEIQGSTADGSATWKNVGLPYTVTGVAIVAGASTPVLTIQPGVTVKFRPSMYLQIGNSSPGQLIANGTLAQPILFTADQATVTAGYYYGVTLSSSVQSQLSYLTIEGAGKSSTQASGLKIFAGNHTIDRVTLRTNAYSGLMVAGGSPTVTNSTITGTTVSDALGVDLYSPANLTIRDSAITGNAGAPIAIRSGATLNGMTGMTLSPNGVAAIRYRSSAIAVNETWPNYGLPYYLDTLVIVSATTTPVLTIQPGVTVKFRPSTYIQVGGSNPGKILANGTLAQPILFTTDQGTVTPGYYYGVTLSSSVQSQLSYLTIEGAGKSSTQASGLKIFAGNHVIDRVTLRTHLFSGLMIAGGTPAVTNSTISGVTGTGATGVSANGGVCTISGSTITGVAGAGVTRAAAGSIVLANSSVVANTSGFTNQSPSTPQTAALNYWGAASGPSGSGPGTGQSVSTGVSYEPWLTASPSTPQYISGFTQTNRSINPNVGVNSIFTFTTSLAGTWTLRVMTSVGAVVRTFTGSGASGTATWDGKNDGGVPQPNGTYTYELSSTTAGGQSATPARGLVILDTTFQATLTGLAVSQAFFSPNGNGVQDTTTLTGTVAPAGGTWTVNVRNSANAVVRTYTGSAPTLSVTWDGKNGSGAVQPDGAYALEAIATYGTTTATATLGTTLDNTAPVSAVTAPAPSQVISNVHQNGSTNFGVTGTASDTNLTSWTLDYGLGSAPSSWPTIGTGTSGVSGGALGTWATGSLTNGTFTLRLRTWDRAGNLTTNTVAVTVGNFKLTQNVLQVNAPGGETITYTSTVPFTLTETIFLKNEAGQTVRTLFSGSRAAGTYNDAWDGKGPSGQYLASGGYFVVANLSAGGSAATWDQSTQYLNDLNSQYPQPAQVGTFDPLNNQPLKLTYTSSTASRVSVFLAPTGDVVDSCVVPQVCLAYEKYEESGTHTVTWAGVSSTGQQLPATAGVGVVRRRTFFPRNAVVVYGTRPSLTNLAVTPPRVVSGATLNVAFDLATFQSSASSITVTFLNQASLSVLKTVTLPAQAPGHVTIPWDTRADNGMLVAPGRYVITVSGQDGLGQTFSSQILATVQF